MLSPKSYDKFCSGSLLQYKPGANPENILNGFKTLHEALTDFVITSEHCPSYLKKDYEKANSDTLDDIDEEGDVVEENLDTDDLEYDALHIEADSKIINYVINNVHENIFFFIFR